MCDFRLQDMGSLKVVELGPTAAEAERGRLAHKTLFCVKVRLLLRVGKCVPRSSTRDVNSGPIIPPPPQLHLGSLITIRAELPARHKRAHLVAPG